MESWLKKYEFTQKRNVCVLISVYYIIAYSTASYMILTRETTGAYKLARSPWSRHLLQISIINYAVAFCELAHAIYITLFHTSFVIEPLLWLFLITFVALWWFITCSI